MPKNAHFGHYTSPNLIIVPTGNFHPPPPTGWEQIADPITSSPSTNNCEQISPVNYNIHPSPYVSNCNQQDLKFVNAEVFFNCTSAPEFPEKFQNPPLIYQNSILTQASSSNMSQSIKELSTYKYKSRNNLVDLTGFNLLKRDSTSSLAKRQDLKQIDDTKIEPDKIKTSSEKELRHCSDSDTCKTGNARKEFAKNMKPKITDDERNPENHANGKPKENTNGNIKKYVREVWKRNFEKFQEKTAKEKLSGVIKSSSTKKKQDSKESKHESSKIKAHLQTSSKRKSTSTKDLNKITEGSKKHRDLERRIVDKYPKRSKTETNSRNLQDSKVSIRDRVIDSSRDAKRQYDDHKIKCKRQLKTESLPREKIRVESRETTNIKRKIDVKKKIDELKQYIKSDKYSKVSTTQTTLEKDKNYTNIEKAIDQANTSKALVKSFVRGDRNLSNNLSQRVNVEGVQDLRPKINQSRKRLRSESFVHNQEPMEKRLDQKSLVISVKQGVETGSENSAKLAPPVDEPKAKKCKPIDLIKNNMKYPDSDSGDIDQNPPEDLSFLDDLIIHADEIVASLPRSSQFEHSLCLSLQMTTTDNTKSELIKEISGSKDNEEANPKKSSIIDHNMESLETNKTKGNYSKNNEETKSTEDRNHYDSMKAIAMMQKEGTTMHNRPENNETPINNIKVKDINSDTEGVDKNLEIGSIANTKKNEDVKNMNQNTKNYINSQDEENNKTDMTEKVYGEIKSKGAMRLCKDKQTIIITITAIKTKKDASTIKDLTEKAYEKNASKQTRSSNSKYDIKTKQEGKKLTDFTENDYEEIGPKETMSLCTANDIMSICKPSGIITTNSKYEKQTEQPNKMATLTGKDEEIAPKETTSLCKAKEIIITNSKCDINTNQEGKKINDLIGNDNKDNAPKEIMSVCTANEIMSLCKVSGIIITNSKYEKQTEETNNMAALAGKDYEQNASKETTSLCKANEIILSNSKYEKQTTEQRNNMAALTGKDNYQIAPKETSLCKASEVIITNSKYYKQTTEQPYNITLIEKDEEIAPKETASLFKDKEIIITNSKCEINTNQEGKAIIDLIGNDYKEIAPKETRRLCKSKRTKIKTNSKHERNTNKKQSNYITDLTGKDLRLELCEDSDDSVVEVIDITEENEYNTTSKHLQPNVSTRTDLGSNAKVLFREHDGETPLDTLRVTLETQVKHKSESANTDQKQTQLHNDNSQNSKDTVEASLNKMLNNSNQNGNTLNHIENYQIYDKKAKEISVQRSVDAMELSLETILNGTNRQVIATNKPSLSGQLINVEIVEDELKIAQSTIEAPPKTIIHKHDENGNEKMEIEQANVEAQESINQILQETTKNSIELNVGIQIDAKPLNVSNIQENLSQTSGTYTPPLCRSDETFKEQAQTFEDTFNKVAKKPIDDIEKSAQNGLENTSETVNSSLAQNNEAEIETLQISEQTIQTSSNTTIVTTKLEQIADSRIQSNMSDNYLEKKNKILETSDLIISEESREKTHTRWSRIEYKTDGTTNEVAVPHKHIEDTSEKKSEVVTNTKKVDNKCLVPDGRKNKDQAKSNEQEKQLSPRLRHYISLLELGMSNYLQKEYTITSIVNIGRWSIIYKCVDTEGGAYALKVVRERSKGKFIKGIFSQMERFRTKEDLCILYLINALEFQKQRWCFLTEYFPKNLKQVLDENKGGIHIDQVQVLSRQLVDAVNTVARAGIIHTDIKPKHILLNSAQDRLKLCGFDRSSYLNSIKVTPSTGSTKYRAPEVILGFEEKQNNIIAAMDVWSTGLVIFEMATNKSLFNASYNNGLLYEQLCTFGSFDWAMVQKSKYSYLYFSGSRFIRRLWPNGYQKIMMKDILERNDNLREKLFDSYNQHWAQNKSKWQITKEMDKLETLHTLLQQMLELDPRHRLPIEFVNASEFMTHTLTTA